MTDKFENFVLAFDSGCGGCRRRCRCGREFYDAGNSSYDWDEGEFEALEADSKATPLGYSVGTISLDGSEYALDCDCWHKRAEMIMKFIDGHAHAIAQYLTLEKQRKQDSADAAPVVT